MNLSPIISKLFFTLDGGLPINFVGVYTPYSCFPLEGHRAVVDAQPSGASEEEGVGSYFKTVH